MSMQEPFVIEERRAEIGPGATVGRLLPFRKKRLIGAFCFIDHGGPVEMKMSGPGLGQHPHIGISTLSYLLEGQMYHADSIGSQQTLEAGSVGWMTAGRGIVHGEGAHPENKGPMRTHLYQIWVSLPKEKEDIDPSFHYSAKEDLPRWPEGEVEFTLVAGEAMGRKSPVPVYSPLYLIDAKFPLGGTFSPASKLYGEFGAIPIEGSLQAGDVKAAQPDMLVADAEAVPELKVSPGSRILILGGQPFPEKRHYDWNFVSTDPEKLKKAKDDWINRRFTLIEGYDSYVPYPGT